MDPTTRQNPSYSPVPGVIPGETDVRPSPVARDEEPTPIRGPRPAPEDPARVRPWQSGIAAMALMAVVVVIVIVALVI